jgi:hypothetical protein
LNLLIPGLESLEIWENPILSHGYWHFGHGDFIFHNEPNEPTWTVRVSARYEFEGRFF